MQPGNSVRFHARWVGILALILAATVALVGHAPIASADDHEQKLTGVIDSRPDEPTTDDWLIDGKVFAVNEETNFEGDLAVNTCAEVEYVETDTFLLALKIASKSDDDCDDDPGDDEEHLKLKGFIDSRPENPTDDTWVIHGQTFLVNEETELEGDLALNTCVEVEYVETDDGFLAIEIEADDNCGDEPGDDEPGDDEEFKGIIHSRPEEPTGGNWEIGDKTFLVNEETEFEGDLAVNTCAEVEYVETDAGLLALEIESDDDCDDDPEDDPEDGKKKGVRVFFGKVSEMPEDELTGLWKIGERSVMVTGATNFKPTQGPFDDGVCVKVKYTKSTGETEEIAAANDDDGHEVVAVDLQTMPAPVCNKGPGSDRHDDRHDDEDDDDRYGRIDAMPEEGVSDTWIIDGVEYTQSDDTEFETEHGDFAVGVCVEFEVDDDDPTVLTELETERDHKCKEEGKQHPEGVIFGIVKVAPDGLTGTWTIGNYEIVSDESTTFKLQKGPAVKDALVKVKFYVDENGVNRALEIQTKYMKEKDDDDDGDGFRQGAEGKVYGIIQEFPDGNIGDWLISGITYIATEDTEFNEDDGPFADDVQVKVKYIVQADGRRVAKEIETTDDNGGVQSRVQFKLVAFIDSTPEFGFNGSWLIGGADFLGVGSTLYLENNGLLVDGAYVQVIYEIAGNARRILQIQTEVPPGAGDIEDTGPIESISDASLAAASLDAGTAIWRIDGVDYVVSPATNLNDSSGTLDVGSTVLVNSYLDDSGNSVATQIQGITQDNTVYLPFTVSR